MKRPYGGFPTSISQRLSDAAHIPVELTIRVPEDGGEMSPLISQDLGARIPHNVATVVENNDFKIVVDSIFAFILDEAAMVDAVPPMTSPIDRVALAVPAPSLGEILGMVPHDKHKRLGSIETLLEGFLNAARQARVPRLCELVCINVRQSPVRAFVLELQIAYQVAIARPVARDIRPCSICHESLLLLARIIVRLQPYHVVWTYHDRHGAVYVLRAGGERFGDKAIRTTMRQPRAGQAGPHKGKVQVEALPHGVVGTDEGSDRRANRIGSAP